MADEPQTNSLAELSLAEYRAQRETPADATPAAEEETTTEAAGANDADAADDDAPESTERSDESEQHEKPAKKGGFQRKIEKLSRENEELKRQLAQGAAKADDATAASETPQLPQYSKAKPKLEDFDSIEAFTDSLTDWKAEKRDFDKAQAEAQAKAQEEATKLVEGWNQRQAEAKKTHSDYDDVIEAASDIPLSPAHQRLFLESEHGAEIAYQLAADKKKLEAFAGANPLAAARMFGKLEAALASDDAPHKETKVSNAPRPIRPIAGRTPAPAASFDPTKASLAEYRRWRERTGRA